MLGNTATVAALKNMLSRGTLPHTLLFHGPSGNGKTTLARIVSEQLGCDPVDLRELNSASYRGIESIRDIARTMNLSPVGKCRVYIMDEAHKLTNDGQNAALKMLEDTPPHVYFMLCTTDPDKLIKAIRSRCTEMPVRVLTHDELSTLAKSICRKERITLAESELLDLVDAAGGSARALLVMLEKVAMLDDADARREAIASGPDDNPQVIELCRALVRRDPWAKVARLAKDLQGDPEAVRWAVLGYARACLLDKKPSAQAYFVIQAFASPFYDSKEAGLAAACYESIHGEG